MPNFLSGKEPSYKTKASSFFKTFYNLNWDENGKIPVEEIAKRVNSRLEKYPANEEDLEETFGANTECSERKFVVKAECSERKFGDSEKSSERKFGEVAEKQKSIGKTAQKIIDLVISDPTLSAEAMAYHIGISSRAVEKQIAKLRTMGILSREGADFGGYWRIIVKP